MRKTLLAAIFLVSLCPALAAPPEASDADVARFVTEAVSATLTRGGETTDASWLSRMVSLSTTEGANEVFRFWAAAGVPDEPGVDDSYAAQVNGQPEVRRLDKAAWKARAIVLQTYDKGGERGAVGMTVETRVAQDPKSGALRLEGLSLLN